MPIVQDSILVRAPQEPLYRLLQDYALRLRWDPFLREMRFLDGATEAAVGVRTWVRAWTGLTMETVYTTLSSPSVVAMKMTRGPSRHPGPPARSEAGCRGTRSIVRAHRRCWYAGVMMQTLARG